MRRCLMLLAAGLSVIALMNTANAGVQSTPFQANLDAVANTAPVTSNAPALDTLAGCPSYGYGGGYSRGYSGYGRGYGGGGFYARPVSVGYGRPVGYGGFGGGFGPSYYSRGFGGYGGGFGGYSSHIRRGSGFGVFIGGF